MAIGTPKQSPLHFTLLTLILLTTPSLSSSFAIATPSSFYTLFSLSHSLLTRVAHLSAARGYISGSAPARTIAHKIEKHSSCWDRIQNYARRDVAFEMFGVVSDIYELRKGLTELSRLESGDHRAEWVRRNYGSLLRNFFSLFNRLLKVFPHSGPLKNAVVMVEIVDGVVLEDCLELGSSGLRSYALLRSVDWDSIENYAWRDVGFEMFGVVSDINELMKDLTELSRLESGVDQVEWVRRNFGSLLKPFLSLFNRLLKVFTHSGPLKDYLELGSSDLKGVELNS